MAGERGGGRLIVSDAVKSVGAYSLGWIVDAGRTVYLAGHVPTDVAGNTVGVGDPERQMRQIFDNMKASLAVAGAALDDVVKMTVFMTDIARDSETYRRVRAAYFTPPLPASTLVQVARLVRTEWVIEIEAVAVIGPRAP